MDIERFAQLRREKGIKQEALAHMLGVARSTVAMWCSGRNDPSHEYLKKLADILGCSTDYLLGRTNLVEPDYPDDDDDLWTLREEMRRDPERRRLFKLAAHASIDDVKAADALLNALKATNPDFYDGDDPA